MTQEQQLEPQVRANDDWQQTSSVVDTRFRKILGAQAWRTLPPEVQKRFSTHSVPGDMKLYRGEVLQTRMTFVGRMLANVVRVIGAPLPLKNGATGPSVVSVVEDPKIGGQAWSRSYAFDGHFPQVVHSAKRFQGPTGLEEYVGKGVGVTLQLSVRDRALVFTSDRYFWEAVGVRFYLPAWVTPGVMEIVHEQQVDDTFHFKLTLQHPWFGRLLDQLAVYRDVM